MSYPTKDDDYTDYTYDDISANLRQLAEDFDSRYSHLADDLIVDENVDNLGIF